MPLQLEWLATEHPDHLVDAIREHESTVVHGDQRVVFVDDLAVQIHHRHHTPPARVRRSRLRVRRGCGRGSGTPVTRVTAFLPSNVEPQTKTAAPATCMMADSIAAAAGVACSLRRRASATVRTS